MLQLAHCVLALLSFYHHVQHYLLKGRRRRDDLVPHLLRDPHLTLLLPPASSPSAYTPRPYSLITSSRRSTGALESSELRIAVALDLEHAPRVIAKPHL